MNHLVTTFFIYFWGCPSLYNDMGVTLNTTLEPHPHFLIIPAIYIYLRFQNKAFA